MRLNPEAYYEVRFRVKGYDLERCGRAAIQAALGDVLAFQVSALEGEPTE